ncbi:MAG: plasmid mobilization protein [Burkholderiales bacterium]
MEKRDNVKKIRFGAQEWAEVEAKAQAAGITPSAWVRQAALTSLPAKIPELNRDAWVKLAPVLSNLNQITRQLNLYQDFVAFDLRVIVDCLTKVRAEVGALRSALIGAGAE